MPDLRLFAVFVLLAAACSGNNETNADADMGPGDAEVSLDAGTTPDAEDALDASSDTASDQGTDQSLDCTDCTDAIVSLDGRGLQLERAFFGITDASLTDSGGLELHVEAHRGGGTACPTQDSPSPDQTVIITNVQVPEVDGASQDEGANLAVSYLDFASELTEEVVLSAMNESLSWGTYDGETISFDLSAPLPGGSIEGRIVAIHCDSMDLNP